MTRAYIAGAGMTSFGPHDGTLLELFADAGMPAMDDARVGRGEVEALFLGNTLGE